MGRQNQSVRFIPWFGSLPSLPSTRHWQSWSTLSQIVLIDRGTSVQVSLYCFEGGRAIARGFGGSRVWKEGWAHFTVHRGDTKDPVDSPDRGFVPADTPEIWLREGDVTIYISEAEARGFANVHYACADCSNATLDAGTDAGPLLAGLLQIQPMTMGRSGSSAREI